MRLRPETTLILGECRLQEQGPRSRVTTTTVGTETVAATALPTHRPASDPHRDAWLPRKGAWEVGADAKSGRHGARGHHLHVLFADQSGVASPPAIPRSARSRTTARRRGHLQDQLVPQQIQLTTVTTHISDKSTLISGLQGRPEHVAVQASTPRTQVLAAQQRGWVLIEQWQGARKAATARSSTPRRSRRRRGWRRTWRTSDDASCRAIELPSTSG